ncbi:MAG: bifunctional UDP-N-acetylglucosamine diphosphorylase/glucosamine-1-phosphate N-acetyltransferase GlmU [Desulfomonilaceae bacterium]
MKRYGAVILAAGKGTRMKSNYCKILHPIAGRPMLAYVLDAVSALTVVDKMGVVIGHQADAVTRLFQRKDLNFLKQEPQLGTGHAVKQCAGLFREFNGHLLIICGDTPLIKHETLAAFVEYHDRKASLMSVLTTNLENPFGYGRILRDKTDNIEKIVEERDANSFEKAIKEINTGIYIVESNLLFGLLDEIRADNSQKEYYLTDVVTLARARGVTVFGCHTQDSSAVIGINSRADLAAANSAMWDRIRRKIMSEGATLLDPPSFYGDFGITVGPDTVIYPNVVITGNSVIGNECLIEPGCLIGDSKIGDRVRILLGSKLDKVEIGSGSSIGPMANLRPDTKIGRNARIGNFVEVKNSIVGEGSKAAHLTYLGDSRIGEDVNIGCGTITCNYDGKNKHQTIIEKGCFIGSDVQFVAPVTIGSGSVIGAGSTITKDVPPNSLAVSRCKQKIFPLRSGQGMASKHEDR